MTDYLAVLREIADELSEELPNGTQLLCQRQDYFKPQPGVDWRTGEKKLMATPNTRMQIVLSAYCKTRQDRCVLLTQLFDPPYSFHSSKEVTVAQAEAIWRMREMFALLIEQTRTS